MAGVTELDGPRLIAARLRAQRLTGGRPKRSDAAVRSVVAVQAQAMPPARLAVRARTTGLTAATVDGAVARRTLVQTWLMRGTLHLCSAADLRWLVALLGPVAADASRRRRAELKVDDRVLAAVAETLAGSPPLTRAALIDSLAVPVDKRGQAPAYVVAYAAMRGLICRAGERSGEPTYALLDDWVPGVPTHTGDDALAELARRYLAGYGPAGVHDFAAWSGLPMPRARHAFELIAGDARPVRLPDGPGLALSTLDTEPEPVVRLLGGFDTYLLGWRGRGLILDPAHARKVQRGGGMVGATVLVDGRIAGVWRRTGQAVTVEMFGRCTGTTKSLLEGEADDLARFLGLESVQLGFG